MCVTSTVSGKSTYLKKKKKKMNINPFECIFSPPGRGYPG